MKLSTAKWFLTHPQYIPQAVQLFKRRLFDKADRYREEDAIKWCEESELSLADVFTALCIDQPVLNIETLFPDHFAYAHDKVQGIPVTMGGPGGLTTLYNIIRHQKPTRILETGVAYGWSSLAILLAVKEIKHARLISVDMPYVGMNNEPYVGSVVHEDLRTQWMLIRKADRQGIPEAIKKHGGNLDLVHYDSDKSYSGRLWAYPILWNALVPGGIFVSDDIQDNIGFKEFCERIGEDPLIHQSDEKFVGILRKPV